MRNLMDNALSFDIDFSDPFWLENRRGRHAGVKGSGASNPTKKSVDFLDFLISRYHVFNYLGWNPPSPLLNLPFPNAEL